MPEYHGTTERYLGQRLLNEKLVTGEELRTALKRQKVHGGRLGDNLVALGYLTCEMLHTFFSKQPLSPQTVEETGLELSFISDLILKHIVFMGEFTLTDIVGSIKLPLSVADAAVEMLRRERCIEVKGASNYDKVSYKLAITQHGRNRATELLDICRYVGPAPVRLEAYNEMIGRQTVKNVIVREEDTRKAFSHLIVSDELLRRLGPAVSSGKAIFIYGPPGNGKTSISETIGRILPGGVYIPYALTVEGQIIKIFDPVTHIPLPDQQGEESDRRWLLIKRPIILTGGELTLRMLDLDFNPIAKFYEAPLQVKSNNGLFMVDDFGRQQMDPSQLLNRWIAPLERSIDFLTLHTGMKFDIPFDQLVIFATNIEPKNLVDEAFLRRIRYKIKIDHPTEAEYRAIFTRVCGNNGIEFNHDVLEYLIDHHYKRSKIKFNSCHPRDLIDHIIDDAHYYNHPPQLTREGIDSAWKNYFVDM